MGGTRESGEEKKVFTIRDRRVSSQGEGKPPEEPPKGESASSAEQPKSARGGREPITELPEVSFSSFILSLSTSARVHLGEVPDPVTQKVDKHLPLAKQTIDLLGLLREKTRNNLDLDEENLFDHLLYDLRLAYIKEVG